MTFFPDPIKPSEGRKEDIYTVHAIEADPYPNNRSDWHSQTQEKRSKAFPLFLILLRHLTELFINKRYAGGKARHETAGLTQHLERLKELLIQIQQVDQSSNSSFYEALASVWMHLLQEAQVFSYPKQKQKIDLQSFLSLIHDIGHFPTEKEHPLGYYLSHYAGTLWLPLPFRDILKTLYLDYQANKQISVLSQWIRTIETLI